MIDVLTEELIPFTEAAKLFPPRRRGRRPSLSCIYRWTAGGCKGVVLESVQAGGTRCTTREAVKRFIERLTNDSGPAPAAVTSPKAPHSPRNARATAQAAAYLDREGV
jgi:hypothetical protein